MLSGYATSDISYITDNNSNIVRGKIMFLCYKTPICKTFYEIIGSHNVLCSETSQYWVVLGYIYLLISSSESEKQTPMKQKWFTWHNSTRQ